MFPFLSLNDVNFDLDLARRLPRRLAYYHLALPIAEDAEGITVAMVHPDNQKVVSVLERALSAKVIPVSSFPELIRQQLDRVWQVPAPGTALRVVHWAQTADELASSTSYVDGFLGALGRDAQVERSSGAEVAAAGADLVIAATQDEQVWETLFRAPSSLLILCQPTALPHTILHVLRGHNPDYRVLDSLIPLARSGVASVTLLMGVDGGSKKPLVSDLSNILMGQDKRQAHLAECRRLLNDAGISGRLHIRQDALLAAIREELAERRYDLVAIAAEAYGDFAHQVGSVIRAQTPAFLVIKP